MIRSLLLATAALTISGPALAASGAPIMPAPVSDTPREGAYALDARTVIAPAEGDAPFSAQLSLLDGRYA